MPSTAPPLNPKPLRGKKTSMWLLSDDDWEMSDEDDDVATFFALMMMAEGEERLKDAVRDQN